MEIQFDITDTRYSSSDIASLSNKITGVSLSGTSVTIYGELSASEVNAIKSAIAAGEGIYEFRGVRVRSAVDVDNVVSAAVKEAIAPGRPHNLQDDAEKALISKFTYAQAVGDAATVTEIKSFYENVVIPIRAEGNAFIAARGW